MGDKLLDYKKAQQKVLDNLEPVTSEQVDLDALLGRVLAQDLCANCDLPRYDNSAMDGFALRSEDAEIGSTLKIIGEVAAGSNAKITVEPGTAARIMTGAVIPEGADAVIPVEKVDVEADHIRPLKRAEKGDHVRSCGEDLQQGALALTAGTVMTPAGIGLAASFGYGSLEVYRKPTVAILSGGNELVEPGRDLGPSQIYDSNTAALSAAVTASGGVPIPLGIACDDRNSLQEKILSGLDADMVITSAGASVGEYDLLREVLCGLGMEEIFWGVSIKPGKPTGFSLGSRRPVFCLPGNPVSALVTFELFVRPALRKMVGQIPPIPQSVSLPLLEPMQKKKARTLFARVSFVNNEKGLFVSSAGSQQTGIMTSLVHADGLAVLPDGQSHFEQGDKVEVIILR